MKIIKSLITLFIIFVTISSFSFSQEPKQTDFSEYKLTDILATPDGTLFLSTDSAGIFRSTDDGNTWFLTSKITKKFTISAMVYDDYEGLFASTKNGGFLQSTDYGKSWRIRLGTYGYGFFGNVKTLIKTKKKYKVFSDDGNYRMSIDNHNFAGFGYLSVPQFAFDSDGFLYGCGSHLVRNPNIDDLKSAWKDITNGLYVFSNCITTDSKNRIYLGTKQGIYYSYNKGDSWYLLSTDLQTQEIISLFVQKDLILAGTKENGVYFSTNSGVNFIHSNSPVIDSAVIKIMPHKSKIYILTKQSGLLLSNDNGQNIEKVNVEVNFQADSVLAQGWMPSINFKDFYPDVGSINMISFLDNDSSFMIKGKNGNYQFYDTKTGILKREYSIPPAIQWRFFSFLSTDSLSMVKYEKSKYAFGSLSTISNNFTSLFSIDSSYFYDEFYKVYGADYIYVGPEISFIKIDRQQNKIYFKYRISGGYYFKGVFEDKYVNKYEIRDISNGEISKVLNPNAQFTNDFNFYLLEGTQLYNANDEFIYDIKSLPENQKFIIGSSKFSVIISPNNKLILLDDKINKKIFVADFNTGIIKNGINYEDYLNSIKITNDDNYFITSPNGSTLKLYNIDKSLTAIDEVVFWEGQSNWKYSLSDNSKMVLFGGTDGMVRLWEPDTSLTSHEDEEYQKPEYKSLLFPNPASDFINVVNTDENPWINPWIKEIKIFDIFGHILISAKTQNFVSLQKINISALPAGVYFVRIGNEKPIKFIKL